VASGGDMAQLANRGDLAHWRWCDSLEVECLMEGIRLNRNVV
jgi:hypothetical protein